MSLHVLVRVDNDDDDEVECNDDDDANNDDYDVQDDDNYDDDNKYNDGNDDEADRYTGMINLPPFEMSDGQKSSINYQERCGLKV